MTAQDGKTITRGIMENGDGKTLVQIKSSAKLVESRLLMEESTLDAFLA